MTFEELENYTRQLNRRFEDHEHTGIDSRPVATSLQSQGSLTAQDSAAVDATYGSEEAGVIANNRTRIAEIEAALIAIGVLE